MMKKTRLAVLMSALVWGGALATGAAVSHAALPEGTSVVAREAAEGPRGGDNERPGDRQRRGGRLTTDSSADVLAAKGSGRGKTRVPGGSGCDDPRDLIEHPECLLVSLPLDKNLVAREASEGPRGGDNERPGDRQRRGGRLTPTDTGTDQVIARRGRGRDDAGCDDHGTDICQAPVDNVARRGRGRGRDDKGCDDHGTDICKIEA